MITAPVNTRERLLEAIDGSSFSDRRLSVLATGSTDTVRNIRRGSMPRLDTLEALCKILHLRLGIDSPYGRGSGREELRPSPELELHAQGLVRAIAAAGGDPIPPELRDRRAAESLQATAARAPLLGNIAAGVPELAEQHHDGDGVTFPAEWSRGATCFAVRVVGDSMIRAGILDGDFAIVRQQETAVDKDIVAATVDGETTLKRYVVEGERAVLAAENPRFRAIDIEGDVRIHGVLVGLLRAYPNGRQE